MVLTNNLNKVDYLLMIFLGVLTLLHILVTVDFSSQPVEDTAMSMRYAENFGDGYCLGHTYNNPFSQTNGKI